jgi:hypothetical protein
MVSFQETNQQEYYTHSHALTRATRLVHHIIDVVILYTLRNK